MLPTGNPTASGWGVRPLPFVIFSVAFLLCAAYMWHCLLKGGLPMDDGNLGQSALRTLHGQLAHRDFGEVYTGLLNWLNAAGFRLFGVNWAAMRYVQFPFFLAYLLSVFYIGTRLVSAPAAALLMMLATAWSVPTFPVPMPSWYNLFFAVFAMAALLRHLETGGGRWLFLAGVCGGLSFLVKVVGLYGVAAAILFLVFREQTSHADGSKPGRDATLFRALVFLGLLSVPTALLLLVEKRLGAAEIYHFVFPASTLVALLIGRELRSIPSSGSLERLTHLLRTLSLYLAGVLLPIAVLLLPYATSESLSAFVQGVFIGGGRAIQSLALARPPGPLLAWTCLPLLALVTAALFWRALEVRATGTMLAVLLGALLLVRQREFLVHGWFSVALLTPLAVLAGAALLSAARTGRRSDAAPPTAIVPRAGHSGDVQRRTVSL